MLRRPLVSAANEEPANTDPFRARRFVSRKPAGRFVTKFVIQVPLLPEGIERISDPAAIRNRLPAKTRERALDAPTAVPTCDQLVPLMDRITPPEFSGPRAK
jgi:hypothetical protein